MTVKDDMDFIDFAPPNPFLPPDWRWGLARLLKTGARAPRRYEPASDPWVGRAREFLAAVGGDGDDVSEADPVRRDPEVHGAYALRSGADGRLRWAVEARLLAGQTDAEVAARCGVPAEVVAAYERLFFDVRDKLGAADHVVLNVIGPGVHDAESAGDPEVWTKLIGYFYGPLALDAVLDALSDGPEREAIDPRVVRAARLAFAARELPTAGVAPAVLLRLARGIGESVRAGEVRDAAAVSGPVVAAFEPASSVSAPGHSVPPVLPVEAGGVGGLAADASKPAGTAAHGPRGVSAPHRRPVAFG